MKIAITGASGFIGQHVLTKLQEQEVEIIAITRGGSLPADLSRDVKIIEMDISRPEPNCFKKIGSPDVLIHLAWDGLPNYKSLHHFEVELPRQYQFLKNMVESGLSSLLVTGTCFEYGMQSGSLSEEIIANPNNPYGYAKNALRQQLEFLKLVTPFNLTWTRLFYMYGQGQSSASLFTKLKDAVERGDKIFNMSGGEQLRDYLPVEEVVLNIIRLAMLQKDFGVINICSGKPISIRKLVERWLYENGWKIELNLGHYPYPDYEPMEFWGDPSRINSINM